MLILESLLSVHRETTEAGFIDCPPPDGAADVWEAVGRLVAGKAVTVAELNALRAAVGRRPFDVECRCAHNARPGLCDCGGALWREGEAKYIELARLDGAYRDAGQGPDRRDLECWRS